MSGAYYTEVLENLGGNIPLRMQLIPAGTFAFGATENELEQEYDRTQAEVSVPAFFLGRYPITQAQWQTVATWQPIVRSLNPNPSYFRGDDLPVERVSWYEAVEFCDRLAVRTGRSYRLPSEFEWEYACRAGTTTPFHFGEKITTEIANYKGAYNGVTDYQNCYEGDYRQTTTPVNHFELANAFGLFDMHGNVWEWCQNHGDYSRTTTNSRAWLTDETKTKRVLRGGSWATYPRRCCSACRLICFSSARDFRNGFRVSCSVYTKV
ncbi:formylglycine-generating enzyme family protein [cf. Phormidesmis sp. LEGE 11477]|uniref:formylglycine-generating enzyme family protein n=1 Tax=cf. Phormidesmis sp. LEGE 11477 TaxID=1828680 RepID=UPI0018813E97|nr:formylglycine-generating enzyme family protein [cf. Phormidesmis sp. LEGE 11477]MBE9060502.1 formylglycine-generating enzyme family protein [cf. Phormidesmis sp. LEGE 11477]